MAGEHGFNLKAIAAEFDNSATEETARSLAKSLKLKCFSLTWLPLLKILIVMAPVSEEEKWIKALEFCPLVLRVIRSGTSRSMVPVVKLY